MKNICLSIVVGLFTTGVMAQSVQKTKEVVVRKTTKTPMIENQSKINLWENDFSTPSDWTIQDLAGSGDKWVIGTTPPTGMYAISPINSTTKTNGFALFDSDKLCSNNQNSIIFNSTAIDLSTEANVSLEFESYYRKFQGTVYVGFSTDATNWTYVEVHTDLNVNDGSTNPEIVSVPAPVIGGSSTAYICFRYVGGCDYAWMVDDVKIVKTLDYDLKMTYSNYGTEDYQYSQIPLSQVDVTEFKVGVTNIGINNLTNVGLTLYVTGQETTTINATPIALLTPGQVDTLVVSFTPTANGTYNFSRVLSLNETDENPTNNSGIPDVTFTVTDHIYAVDKGAPYTKYTPLDSIYLEATIPYTELGTSYDIYTQADLYGIDVYLDAATQDGSSLYGILYAYNSNASTSAELWQAIVETDLLDVTSSTPRSAINSLLFPSSITLDPGTYMISVRELNEGVAFGGSGYTTGSTQSWAWIVSSSNGDSWTGLSTTPVIRMNFDPSLAVNTIAALEGVRIYPNPSNGVINVSNDNNLDNTITVKDVNGKVIASKSTSVATTIDLSSSTAGIYFVEVINQNGKKIEKIVIE
ncbi:MAG: T9SS type A sorting domain-containing protein [Crocinitomicaceae bacterium]|nr:T9SS type A sorting domain-containing protein [Crocinitomicaceae bacterium]